MAFFAAKSNRSVHEDLRWMTAMAQADDPAAPRSPKIRTRLHTLGAILCAVGVFAGVGNDAQSAIGERGDAGSGTETSGDVGAGNGGRRGDWAAFYV